MTLTQLEVFNWVAQLGGFSLAAQQLDITQSAVSHAVKSLEKELGVELFERQQGKAELTEVGARLLPRAREMLGIAETIRQESQNAKGLNQGTIRIGSFGPTSSLRLLPRILEAYRHKYPGVEVHVDEGNDQDVVQWIQERRVDLGFVQTPDERFTTYPLVEDQIVAVLPKTSPLANERKIGLEALCHDPFIMTEAGSSGQIHRLFASERLSPRIRYRNSQVMSTVAMVARGDGVALLAELALPPETDDLDYVIVPLDTPHKRSVGLGVHNARQLSPAAQAFIKTAERLKERGRFSSTGI